MSNAADPSIHRAREEQIIRHVKTLLGDERLRLDTILGRRAVTAFAQHISEGDGEIELKRLMTELRVPDRELMARMPVGRSLDVALTRSHLFFFNQEVGRLKVICLSPSRDLLKGEEPRPISAGDVTKLLAAMPRTSAPTTIVLVSTSGFAPEARDLVDRRADRVVLLVGPNAAGGWSAHGATEMKAIADLFDPESADQKRDRILAIIRESQLDLAGSGISTDKLAEKAQAPASFVEAVVKDYARATPGLNAKRLDGRFVLYRDGSTSALSGLGDSGGAMGLIDKVKTIFAGKGDNTKKIAFLSERRVALRQQRDRAYEDMTALETQEASLKQQFKDAAGAITKRRVTGQMLQLRKDLDRRQQLVSVLDKQINIVSTHLQNLELVQQGKSAKLPDTDEITADAVKAEEMLAQLEADDELAGSVGNVATAGMTDEEKALFEELEKETGEADKAEEEPAPPQKSNAGPVASKEVPSKSPTSPASAPARPATAPNAMKDEPATPRRLEPEAG